MKKILLKLFVLFTIIVNVKCARILIFIPSPSISHSLFYRPIIRELSFRGHQVVSITTDPMNDTSLTNLTEIDIHDISYSVWLGESKMSSSKFDNHASVRQFAEMCHTLANVNDAELSWPTVKNLIQNRSEHFDLVINEWIMYYSTFVFGYRFNCPVIGITSMPTFFHGLQDKGMPYHPAYALDPMYISGRNLTFWQRLTNAFYAVWRHFYHHLILFPHHDKIARKHFGQNIPYLADIIKNVSLLLENSNPIFHLPRPIVHNVVQIGGLHTRKKDGLPKDLQTFLDNAKEGVVYFSLGSNVESKSLPKPLMKIFINAFKQIPYKVLWKWESEHLEDVSSNVYLKKWLPQQDVLLHKNVKLFIMQGGLQSIEESIKGKVPMIGIPFFADQDYNVARFSELEIGEQILINEINTELLVQTIIKICETPKYRKKVTEVSELLWDQQTTPLNRAIWWVEYVIRHKGAKYLKSPLADLPWYQFLLLDVIGFILILIAISTFIFYLLIKLIIQNRLFIILISILVLFSASFLNDGLILDLKSIFLIFDLKEF